MINACIEWVVSGIVKGIMGEFNLDFSLRVKHCSACKRAYRLVK